MKPDVIISWPRNADYPLWRQMIRDNRGRFNEIIIIFTETNQGLDYRKFVRGAMFQDHVLFVESPPITAGEDWRNVAVNAGLLHSLHSEWLWFTEQDFFPGQYFWPPVESHRNSYDVMATYDGPRMHPCCIFVKRSVLQATKKQFGAHPPEHDHFGQLQKDLESNLDLRILALRGHTYIHMAGLSHNFRLVTDGELPNHQPEQFNKYLADSLRVSVPKDPRFEEIASAYLNKVNYVFE